MGYRPTLKLDYNTLSPETQYRFAEIEMQLAIECLEKIHRFDLQATQIAHRTIFDNTFMEHRRTPEKEAAFFDAVHTNYWKNVRKDELIDYLKWKNASYGKIVKMAKTSPNTIAKMRFDRAPMYFPIFPHWDIQILTQWNLYKRNFNLFEEELIHFSS